MKLSEMSTDRAADVLCELTLPISNIVTDDELRECLRAAIGAEEAKSMTKMQMLAMGVERINKIVPILMKKRREDVYAIIAVLNDTTAEEIGRQNILKTMLQIRETVKDRELMDFFKSCAKTETSM